MSSRLGSHEVFADPFVSSRGAEIATWTALGCSLQSFWLSFWAVGVYLPCYFITLIGPEGQELCATPCTPRGAPAGRHGTAYVGTLIAVYRHMQNYDTYMHASSAQQALAFALESGQLASLNDAWPFSLFSMTPTSPAARVITVIRLARPWHQRAILPRISCGHGRHLLGMRTHQQAGACSWVSVCGHAIFL
jgi:hypothetical protein